VNRNMHLSSREAQLKREASMAAANRWRQANPGYRRRRWHLPQFRPLLGRVAVRARAFLAWREKPQAECC
jgi:hypothetical protein